MVTLSLGIPRTLPPQLSWPVTAMMAVVDEGIIRLRKHLADSKLPTEVVTFITDNLQLESISDFAGFFTESSYQDGVSSEILDHIASYKGNALMRGRLRTSWQLASAEFSQAVKRKANAVEDEAALDEPLDPAVRKQQEGSFAATYGGLKFAEQSTPSDFLFARVYREFKKQSLTVHDVENVRSAATQKTIMQRKTRRIGAEGLSISFNEPDHHETGGQVTSVLEFLTALKILVQTWAMCGLALRESKLSPGTKIKDADLSACYAYLDFVTEHAIGHQGQPSEVLQWLIHRDRTTRSRARSLYADGWPWSEAIQECVDKHCAVIWTCANLTLASGSVSAVRLPANQPDNRAVNAPERTIPKTRQSQLSIQANVTPCPHYNGPNGCSRKQKQCPLALAHVCSGCGAWQHNIHACPGNGKSAAARGKGGKGGGRIVRG